MAPKKKAQKKNNKVSIEETIKTLKAKYGEDAIVTLNQKPLVNVDSIPTGSFGLDMALGIGGFPQGRIVEIYGPESSGKTTLALHVIAEAQKKGGHCAFIDAEHALDPEYAKKIGVQTDLLYISQPSYGEEALGMVEDFVESNNFAVIVVDSVASLTPKAEIEGEMGDQHVGRHAKLMSQALRKLVGITANSKTIVIFINQLRMSIGVPYGNPEFTPGGKALKFYSSVRLDIRRIAQIKKGEDVVGGRVRVKVVKNKVAPPFRVAEFDLLYGEGISKEGELLAMGEKKKIVSRAGAFYSFGDIKLGRGYDAARKFLLENQDIKEQLVTQVTNIILEDQEAEVDLEEDQEEQNDSSSDS